MFLARYFNNNNKKTKKTKILNKLNDLPNELIYEICLFLGCLDIFEFSMINKTFHGAITRYDYLWKKMIARNSLCDYEEEERERERQLNQVKELDEDVKIVETEYEKFRRLKNQEIEIRRYEESMEELRNLEQMYCDDEGNWNVDILRGPDEEYQTGVIINGIKF
jgi:hypothetical protein